MAKSLITQWIDDLRVLQFSGSAMFKTVAPGVPSDKDIHKDSPHAKVHFPERRSDPEEPQLGERDLMARVWIFDRSGSLSGSNQVDDEAPVRDPDISGADHATYEDIVESIEANLEYKAGGVYERSVRLSDISTPEETDREGLWFFDIKWIVALG